MPATMSEMVLQLILGLMSAVAVIFPVGRLVRVLIKEAFPKSIKLVDSEGTVLGEISAASVQQADTENLVRLHERIRHRHDVATRAA